MSEIAFTSSQDPALNQTGPPEADLVYMRKEGLDSVGGPVPRSSFDAVWAKEDWYEVTPQGERVTAPTPVATGPGHDAGTEGVADSAASTAPSGGQAGSSPAEGGAPPAHRGRHAPPT